MRNRDALPNQMIGSTTSTVGFVHTNPETVAAWWASTLDNGWADADAGIGTLRWLIENTIGAEKTPLHTKYLLAAAGDWSLVLTDGPVGTDPAGIPSLAAEDLGVTAVRATVSEPGPDQFAAAMIEVFDQASADQNYARRHVYAAHNGYSWDFGQYGKPYDFENVESYQKGRIKDRFTTEMVHQFLANLEVPEISLNTETRARLVYRTG